MISTRPYTIAVGGEQPDTVRANFIRCLASAGQILEVQMENMDGTTSRFEMEAGLAFSVKMFEKIRIRNKGTATSIAKFVYSDEGFIQDNRLVGNLDLNGTISVLSTLPSDYQNVRFASVGTVFTEILPLNNTRRACLVQVNNPVYIGTTDSPILNGSFSWDNQKPLMIRAVTGTVEVRATEEFD